MYWSLRKLNKLLREGTSFMGMVGGFLTSVFASDNSAEMVPEMYIFKD